MMGGDIAKPSRRMQVPRRALLESAICFRAELREPWHQISLRVSSRTINNGTGRMLAVITREFPIVTLP